MAGKQKATKKRLLTPTEVADLLLIAPVTVRLWANRSLLPSVTTPGGHRRFRTEDVEAFIARRNQVNANPSITPSRVLIIDDDAQYSQYLAQMLRKLFRGINVETAGDGFVAGMKTEAMRPDLVTLDLQMRGMDGFAVCQLLRSMPMRARMRIVVLTGFPSADNIAKALSVGADSCISKAVTTKRLLKELGFSNQLKS